MLYSNTSPCEVLISTFLTHSTHITTPNPLSNIPIQHYLTLPHPPHPPQPPPNPLIPTNSPTPRKYAYLDTPPTPRRAFCRTSSLYQEQPPRKVSAPYLKPFPSYSHITIGTTGSILSRLEVPSVPQNASYSALHLPERSRHIRSGSQPDLIPIQCRNL